MSKRGTVGLRKAMGKRRWAEADARMVLTAWRRSGKRVSELAREQGLTPQRLLRWSTRLQGRSRVVRFHPVRLVGVEPGGEDEPEAELDPEAEAREDAELERQIEEAKKTWPRGKGKKRAAKSSGRAGSNARFTCGKCPRRSGAALDAASSRSRSARTCGGGSSTFRGTSPSMSTIWRNMPAGRVGKES